jgi:surfeit locus 1 family protein
MTAQRQFRPRPLPTVLMLLGCALFVRLGLWQWHKGGERQLEWQRFARGAGQVVPLAARSLEAVPLYQRVRVSGTLDGAHQFLLDNRTQDGRPGYEVLTPLERNPGRALLLDRGWVPFGGSRQKLPAIALPALPAGTADFTGRVAWLPASGLASGRAAPDPQAPWPKVTSFPDSAQLADALGRPLETRIVLLDADQPLGFGRDWQPPGIPPLRHFSYAAQWWTFAALAVVLWGVMSTRRA